MYTSTQPLPLHFPFIIHIRFIYTICFFFYCLTLVCDIYNDTGFLQKKIEV